jgi:hypothetical protein
MIRVVFILDPDPDFLPIPDPGSRGSKRAPDPGSVSATLFLADPLDPALYPDSGLHVMKFNF